MRQTVFFSGGSLAANTSKAIALSVSESTSAPIAGVNAGGETGRDSESPGGTGVRSGAFGAGPRVSASSPKVRRWTGALAETPPPLARLAAVRGHPNLVVV